MTMITKRLPMLATTINDQPQAPTKRDNQGKIVTIVYHIALPPPSAPLLPLPRYYNQQTTTGCLNIKRAHPQYRQTILINRQQRRTTERITTPHNRNN